MVKLNYKVVKSIICLLIVLSVFQPLERRQQIVEAAAVEAPIIDYKDIVVNKTWTFTDYDLYAPYGGGGGYGWEVRYMESFPFMIQNIKYNPNTRLFSYTTSPTRIGALHYNSGRYYAHVYLNVGNPSSGYLAEFDHSVSGPENPGWQGFIPPVTWNYDILSSSTSRNLSSTGDPTYINVGVGLSVPWNNAYGRSSTTSYPLVVSSEAPTIDLTTLDNQILSNEQGLNKYKVQGYVQDGNNDTLTVTAEIAGVTLATTVINTKISKPFEINYDVITDRIPNGIHTVKVTVDDGTGRSATKYLTVTVKSRASNNLYIVIDDIIYYDTLYDDPEDDIKSDVRWKFVHDQNFFESPMGIIPDNQAWRSSPYTQFTKTGHYMITFQNMDTIPLLEYQRWSLDPFDKINLYVHRKPVPRFTIAVYSNGVGGFPTVIDDTSYDLDKRSLNEGIADTEWSWKDSTATVWTNGVPSINLTVNRTYEVKLRVKDHQGLWSAPLIKTFSTGGTLPILTNNPPVATMTIPSGTQANPTVFTTQKPTFSWNQTDPDAATVYKSFEIQVTNEANTATVFSSGTISQNTTATTKSWTATSDLPAGVKLRVRVRVNDGLVWSAWSAQTWMIINRSPVANFGWSPKPVWEGDTITLTNQSTDPDGDPLSYLWTVTRPNGTSYSSTSINFSITSSVLGSYTTTLSVSDGKAANVVVSKAITVGELTVEGQVNHTPVWEEHRNDYNSKYPNAQRAFDIFWAGERFILSAQTTVTGTATQAYRVSVEMDNKLVDLTASDSSYTNWTGEMWEESYENLTNVIKAFTFTAYWNNGTVSTDILNVRINGNIYDYFRNHRAK
jgi:hypothetical protein